MISPSQVGMLYESTDVIRALSRVGYTLFMKQSSGDDTFLDSNNTEDSMLERWEDVFSVCSGNSFLVLMARNFAYKLRMFSIITIVSQLIFSLFESC